MMGYGPFWYGHNAAFSYDHEASLKKLEHRALLLTNSGDMIFELAEYSHKLRPDLDYVVMPGGGVDIVDQQPEQWVDAILEFIAETETLVSDQVVCQMLRPALMTCLLQIHYRLDG